VQNSGINLDFDLFLERKSGGPSPQAMDRTRVAGPRVQRGPHSGRRLELSLVAALGPVACRGGTRGKRVAWGP
jgi:hypothetical protein